MSVKSQQSVTVEFTTAHPTTGAPTSGDTTPTGTLFVDGVANAAAVTVTNITTGVYRAAVTLPTLSAGQIVGIRITAVVATVSGTSVVWQDTADTALVSDNATAIAAIPTTPLLAANYTAPSNADIATIKNAVGTPVNTGGTATIAAILGDPANSSLVARMSAVPAAVWNALTSTLTITGSVGKRLVDFVTTLVYAAPPADAPSASDNATAVWGATTRALTDKVGFSGTATNMRGTDDALLAANYTAPDNASVGTILTNLNDLAADVGEPVGADLSADISAVKSAIPSISGLATTTQETANTKTITDAIAAATPVVDFTDVLEAIAALPDDTDVADIELLLAAIKAKTDDIDGTLFTVTVTSPVAESGTINLMAGDDYKPAEGRQVVVNVADAVHALGLDAAQAVVRLKCAQATFTAASVASTTAGYAVTFALTHEDTVKLTVSRQSYEVEAVLANSDVVTLATGTLTSVPDIPAVT